MQLLPSNLLFFSDSKFIACSCMFKLDIYLIGFNASIQRQVCLSFDFGLFFMYCVWILSV